MKVDSRPDVTSNASALYRFMLPNGLRVWIEPRPQVESITALLVVHAGARYETTADNGLSHFVEHLVFDGTEKWPTEEAVADAVTHRGGQWNAWTAEETTTYYVQLPHADAGLAMEWLSQVVFHPTFPPDKIDKERGVIFQEKMGRYGWLLNVLEALGLGYDLDRQVRRAVFPGSALSLRVIGEDNSLDRLTRPMVIDYHRARYTPANCALIVSGRCTLADLTALVTHHFGAIAARPAPAPPPTPPLPQRGPQRVTVRGPLPSAESELLIGMRTVEATHPDRWALAVLAQIMEESLLKAVRFQRGLAYGVHAFTEHFADAGYFGLRTQIESRHRAEVQQLIEDHFERLRQGQLTEEQLRNAQVALVGAHVLAMEDGLQRADWLAQWALAPDDRPPPDYAAVIHAVTPADVQRVLDTYFTPQRRFVGSHQPIVTVPRVARLIAVTLGCLLAIGIVRRGR